MSSLKKMQMLEGLVSVMGNNQTVSHARYRSGPDVMSAAEVEYLRVKFGEESITDLKHVGFSEVSAQQELDRLSSMYFGKKDRELLMEMYSGRALRSMPFKLEDVPATKPKAKPKPKPEPEKEPEPEGDADKNAGSSDDAKGNDT